MQIEAVIFDMDGLMFDSEKLSMRFWIDLLKEHGYEANESIIHGMIGMNRNGVVSHLQYHFGEDVPLEAIMKRKIEQTLHHYKTIGVPKKEGLDELLAFLKKQRIPIAVATSTYREVATLILTEADIHQQFHTIVCGDEVQHSKPEPEIFLKAANYLGVHPSKCLVLEDSQNGLIAAHKAGMSAVFIKDLVTPHDEVLAHTKHHLHTLHDVIPLFQKANNL